MDWHEARQFYIDPILERMQKDENVPQEGQVTTSDPQGQLENMLSLSMLLAKGKINPAEASKAFFASYGKDFQREGGEKLVARMKEMRNKKAVKKTFANPKVNRKSTMKPPAPQPQQQPESKE